jgi:hypothetical protein
VDPLEIERALVNLVVNARDAMPEGGVVRIGTGAQQVARGLVVELWVADEGRGIDEDDRAHIFEPFYTTRKDAGGTGLGLATVLGTAEQHGGTVRVDARRGGGSVFTIVLPAVESQAEPEAVNADVRALSVEPRSLRLLVVDDEPMIADVTRLLLEREGHEVWIASLPNEALALWVEHGATIDLVICDVAMAQMRGPELIARMAEVGAAPRVLFITGYSEEAVHSELRHPVLGKPFTSAALSRAVHDAIG